MATRRQYDSEFKRAGVELARTSGKTMAELEVELGISAGLLKQWVRAAKRDGGEAFPGNGRLKASDEELRHIVCREMFNSPARTLCASRAIETTFMAD